MLDCGIPNPLSRRHENSTAKYPCKCTLLDTFLVFSPAKMNAFRRVNGDPIQTDINELAKIESYQPTTEYRGTLVVDATDLPRHLYSCGPPQLPRDLSHLRKSCIRWVNGYHAFGFALIIVLPGGYEDPECSWEWKLKAKLLAQKHACAYNFLQTGVLHTISPAAKGGNVLIWDQCKPTLPKNIHHPDIPQLALPLNQSPPKTPVQPQKAEAASSGSASKTSNLCAHCNIAHSQTVLPANVQIRHPVEWQILFEVFQEAGLQVYFASRLAHQEAAGICSETGSYGVVSFNIIPLFSPSVKLSL
ncbi:hypothetical protein Pelo_3778 [Pelomyxa schiedti]|nr:hypothetical protein Pelo_3778 [Pelomyxa schiedti]